MIIERLKIRSPFSSSSSFSPLMTSLPDPRKIYSRRIKALPPTHRKRDRMSIFAARVTNEANFTEGSILSGVSITPLDGSLEAKTQDLITPRDHKVNDQRNASLLKDNKQTNRSAIRSWHRRSKILLNRSPVVDQNLMTLLVRRSSVTCARSSVRRLSISETRLNWKGLIEQRLCSESDSSRSRWPRSLVAMFCDKWYMGNKFFGCWPGPRTTTGYRFGCCVPRLGALFVSHLAWTSTRPGACKVDKEEHKNPSDTQRVRIPNSNSDRRPLGQMWIVGGILAAGFIVPRELRAIWGAVKLGF